MLIKLDYKAKRQEVEDMIWEVDEDCDKAVSWDEFKLMFQRCRTDRVRAAPQPHPTRLQRVTMLSFSASGPTHPDLRRCCGYIARDPRPHFPASSLARTLRPHSPPLLSAPTLGLCRQVWSRGSCLT